MAHFNAAGHKGDGWTIDVIIQPAQSPDLNVLDLGLFASMKRRQAQVKLNARIIDGLLAKVAHVWNTYDGQTLDNVWAHLYAVYNAVLKFDGSNKYDSPHFGARARGKNQATSVSLQVDIENYTREYNIVNREI